MIKTPIRLRYTQRCRTSFFPVKKKKHEKKQKKTRTHPQYRLRCRTSVRKAGPGIRFRRARCGGPCRGWAAPAGRKGLALCPATAGFAGGKVKD